MNPRLKAELDALLGADLPRGDLQGVVWVIARKYGVSDDDCLDYLDKQMED